MTHSQTSGTPSAVNPSGDSTLRAMTDDGAFRVIVARSTGTAKGICSAQSASGKTAQMLSDLMTATVLYRETMSPLLRVQGILRDRRSFGTLIADSAPGGKTRGIVQALSAKKIKSIPQNEEPILQMMRTLPNGSINQGVVRIPPGASISDAMMTYMKESEQVDTMLAVGSVLDESGHIKYSGGYMVQLLPEVGRQPLAIMAERLEDFRTIEHLLDKKFTPELLRDEILYRMPFTPLDSSPLSNDCWCSESRLFSALATLDRGEIQSMVDDGKSIESTCDYCQREFVIQPARLRGLLGEN